MSPMCTSTVRLVVPPAPRSLARSFVVIISVGDMVEHDRAVQLTWLRGTFAALVVGVHCSMTQRTDKLQATFQ